MKMSRRTSMNGVSAIELLVTVSILFVLAAVAVPAFGNFVLNNRGVNHINEFVAAVNFARSEAIKRGAPVTLCSSTSPQANSPTCDGAQQWESGWIAFADYDRDGNMDLGTGACLTEEDCLLQVWDGIDDVTLSAGKNRISFEGTGASRGFNSTWKLCDSRGAQDARAAILSASGHTRQAKDTDGDGILEDESGNNLSCP